MPPHGLEAAMLIGRVLLGGIFLHEAWSKLTGYAAAVRYMEAFGVQGELLPAAIAIEAGCALAVLLGYHTRAAALMLAAFCVVTAVVFHTKLGATVTSSFISRRMWR